MSVKKFQVGVVRGPGAGAFEDFARGLRVALCRLGCEGKGGRPILLGVVGNGPLDGLSENAIIYNTEQIAFRGKPFAKRNVGQCGKRAIWDYSVVNTLAFRDLGLRAVHCPLGYVSEMEVVKKCFEDIDVLFYGAMCPKRLAVLGALEEAGLRVVGVSGVYGKERDALISRAKVVLNIHYYDSPIFEIFRVSHLLANGKCVVSEGGGLDPELEEFAEKTTRLVPYGGIVEACRELVGDVRVRRELEERGQDVFRRLDLVENVKRAIEETEALDVGGEDRVCSAAEVRA